MPWTLRPTPVLAWAVALLIAGAWMATRVPLEWVPKVELPVVRIAASWAGSSPRAMERYVTAPIERAVQGVAGTAGVESISEEGRTTVTLQVAEGTDLGPYVARVNEQLALLRDELPERVTPRLSKQIPEALRDQQGFMTLQLVGAQAPAQLRRLADDRIAPRLRSLPGVADIVVRGGSRKEVRITLNPDRLDAHNVRAGGVQERLRRATQSTVYGRLRHDGHAPLLLTPAEDRVGALGQVIVSPSGASGPPVHLADVGTVEVREAPRRSISRIDGDPVVTLTLDRAPASHMLDVARSVRDRIESLRPSLPADTRLLIADDKSEEVRTQLRDLRWRGGLGLVLVMLVLLVMLKSVRAVGVVLFSVAVALAVAFAALGPLGLTLNLLTIAGLVLVFGLLVDNSVVMTEQMILQRAALRRHADSDADLMARATRASLQAVWLPLLGGTLTTMAVMLPLVYLSGDLQALFLPFGILTALTLAASLITAAVLVPVLGRFLPEPQTERRASRRLRTLVQAPYRIADRFPKTTLAVLVLCLGTPLWLLPGELDDAEATQAERSVPVQRWTALYNQTLGSDAVQDVREWLDPAVGGVVRPFIQNTSFGETFDFSANPEVSVRLSFPPGNPISRADSLMNRFERTALASPVVRRTIARINERSAFLRVQFTAPSLETAEPYILREKLIQEAVLLAGITVSVGGLLPQGYYSGSGGNISGIAVTATGPNYDDLEALAERFAATMKASSRRVAAVNTNAGRYGRQRPRQVLRFRVGADAQARTGLDAVDLTGRLRPVLATRFPAFFADLDVQPRLPVRILVEGAAETDVETLVDRPLHMSDSVQVKLKTMADYAVTEVPSRIERENQQYKRYLRIDYRGPYRMGNEAVNRALEEFATPAGYTLKRERTSFFTDEVQRSFGWVLLATVGLVFLVTVAVFESWRLPGVVLLSVPTAAVGVALGFLWAGVPFAEGAFIGTVLLIGIAANDAILLVDRYRQLRVQRPHGRRGPLVRLAVRERLRPMWTTTLSTCVAMLPLLVFPQDGDFWAGLAVTVTGGLLAATLLAPLATVALMRIGRGGAGSEREIHDAPELP